VEAALTQRNNGKNALSEYADLLNDQLCTLTAFARDESSPSKSPSPKMGLNMGILIGAVITMDVHARDVTQALESKTKNASGLNSFEWQVSAVWLQNRHPSSSSSSNLELFPCIGVRPLPLPLSRPLIQNKI
jgi:hypothetical protein